MSLLSELSAIAEKLKIPAQTSVYSGKAPDEYLVFTPLYDSFEPVSYTHLMREKT